MRQVLVSRSITLTEAKAHTGFIEFHPGANGMGNAYFWPGSSIVSSGNYVVDMVSAVNDRVVLSVTPLISKLVDSERGLDILSQCYYRVAVARSFGPMLDDFSSAILDRYEANLYQCGFIWNEANEFTLAHDADVEALSAGVSSPCCNSFAECIRRIHPVYATATQYFLASHFSPAMRMMDRHLPGHGRNYLDLVRDYERIRYSEIAPRETPVPVKSDVLFRQHGLVGRVLIDICQSADYANLPVLGDALQDVGCDNKHILDHIYGPEVPHGPGCWAVWHLLMSLFPPQRRPTSMSDMVKILSATLT